MAKATKEKKPVETEVRFDWLPVSEKTKIIEDRLYSYPVDHPDYRKALIQIEKYKS